MSNRYQIVVLRRGLALAFFAINFFGLWSFRFVDSKRQIKYSFLKAVYSIFVLLCGISAILIIGLIALNSGNISGFNVFFGSFTLRFVLVVYGQSILVSFVFTYLAQHWLAEEIKTAYIQCKDVVDSMGDSFQKINYSSYLFEMLLKTIIVDIVNVIMSYSSLNSTDWLASRPYFMFALMLPPYAVKLHMNVFYGAVLAIDVYMRKLNCYLVDIVTKATYSTRHKHLKMGNYCFCSDEVDRLSMLYLKLVQATKSINSIFSIQITLWNTTILVTLIVQFLYQFVSIMELALNQNETIMMMINIQGCISFILSSVDLLSTTYACQRINDSVHQTATILHSTQMCKDVDIRFRRSIDIFSTQILLNKLEITECGMFTLDFKVMTLVISSIVSYSVVLLQFELAERKLSTNLKDKI